MLSYTRVYRREGGGGASVGAGWGIYRVDEIGISKQQPGVASRMFEKFQENSPLSSNKHRIIRQVSFSKVDCVYSYSSNPGLRYCRCCRGEKKRETWTILDDALTHTLSPPPSTNQLL